MTVLIVDSEAAEAGVAAAQAALEAHRLVYRLEGGEAPGAELFHILASLLEWSDAQSPKVDFDAALDEARTYVMSGRPA
ncbi:hypothetical protein [Brevundimonas bullata]|uniref:hypothetical protein n=1 Tax=Brevundimonas bullata TaxID=13160 RepID=UPI002FDA3FB7